MAGLGQAWRGWARHGEARQGFNPRRSLIMARDRQNGFKRVEVRVREQAAKRERRAR
jgi:hypothetical protein